MTLYSTITYAGVNLPASARICAFTSITPMLREGLPGRHVLGTCVDPYTAAFHRSDRLNAARILRFTQATSRIRATWVAVPTPPRRRSARRRWRRRTARCAIRHRAYGGATHCLPFCCTWLTVLVTIHLPSCYCIACRDNTSRRRARTDVRRLTLLFHRLQHRACLRTPLWFCADATYGTRACDAYRSRIAGGRRVFAAKTRTSARRAHGASY